MLIGTQVMRTFTLENRRNVLENSLCPSLDKRRRLKRLIVQWLLNFVFIFNFQRLIYYFNYIYIYNFSIRASYLLRTAKWTVC